MSGVQINESIFIYRCCHIAGYHVVFRFDVMGRHATAAVTCLSFAGRIRHSGACILLLKEALLHVADQPFAFAVGEHELIVILRT